MRSISQCLPFHFLQPSPDAKQGQWRRVLAAGPVGRTIKLAAHTWVWGLSPSPSAMPHWLSSRSWVHQALPYPRPDEHAVPCLGCSSWQNPIHLPYQFKQGLNKSLESQIKGLCQLLSCGCFFAYHIYNYTLLPIFSLIHKAHRYKI